ncbi:MAG: hypothetical protein CVT98_00445, partial [Bacteroidetes bacterium HGW-Bacteroidetes-15]
MKTLITNISRMGMFLMLMLFLTPVMGQNGNNYRTINGNLKDSKTKQSLFFAYVTIPGTHIGTVTNSEGDFTLKISNTTNAKEVEFTHLGYKTKRVAIEDLLVDNLEVRLEPSSVEISEITVRPEDPNKLVAEALKKVPHNYSDKPNMFTGFYRETIKQRRDYISISEAIVDIYKAPYKAIGGDDRVKIYRGRQSSNVKKADTLAVKLQGGPKVSLLLDLAKNSDLIFFEDYESYYNFSL